ncbi:hypothetical protein SAMN05216428_102211 [Nitrosospira sp. Nsp11]|uniref:hypothetical protein n=1 Tax=Nitrosospira sp. Nsp11 TaxID=1855338 RepID=UPI0009101A07|nr:hypothetical protein [Nitrosospira sp. Nsp11]SHL38172.1 hypothetical protein SAMN05216428_102211 [Nitrosospira sp. Nsp11]
MCTAHPGHTRGKFYLLDGGAEVSEQAWYLNENKEPHMSSAKAATHVLDNVADLDNISTTKIYDYHHRKARPEISHHLRVSY